MEAAGGAASAAAAALAPSARGPMGKCARAPPPKAPGLPATPTPLTLLLASSTECEGVGALAELPARFLAFLTAARAFLRHCSRAEGGKILAEAEPAVEDGRLCAPPPASLLMRDLCRSFSRAI